MYGYMLNLSISGVREKVSRRRERSKADAAPKGAGTVWRVGTGDKSAVDNLDKGAEYAPKGIEISAERRQELLEEAKRHSDWLTARLGEPSAEAMARAEQLWNEIHGTKPLGAIHSSQTPSATWLTP